jgi:hypothetical protein
MSSFLDVAEAIGARELSAELEALGKHVKAAKESNDTDPLPKDVRKDFLQAGDAAAKMERAIDRVVNRFYWLSFSDLEKLFSARKAIREVTEITRKASASIPSAGRKRARRGDNAREVCATIIIESWALVHGKPPGAHNPRVEEICSDYWSACDCGTIDADNWRRTIRAALNNNSAMRRYIRNELMAQNHGVNFAVFVP